MRRLPVMAACLLVLAFLAPAEATSIVYTETVVGSGTLGQTPFTGEEKVPDTMESGSSEK